MSAGTMGSVGDFATSARSLLFVPGDRPDRFEKAVASGADAVIVDLEDAVAPERKAAALDHLVAFLDAGSRAVVRVNAVGSSWHRAELDRLAGRAVVVMLPKARDGSQVAAARRRLGEAAEIIPLVETAVAFRDLDSICAAPGVSRVAFGHVDLGAELGIDPAHPTAWAHARSELVLASAAAGLVGPIDGVSTALDDSHELARSSRAAHETGFTGKLCVHPRQVAEVNRLFLPSPEEVAWARRVTAHAGAGGVAAHGGNEMVDPPVLARAARILRRAARPET